MNSLPLFLGSPLARHPNLLLRKIGARLGLRHERVDRIRAPVTDVKYPPHWQEALQLAAILPEASPAGPAAEPPAFGRIFGQDFDESQLLQLCRTGPKPGERGLHGDIKLIWDYSRAHPLWPNAILGRHDASAAFLRRWMNAAEDLNGPAWSCAMDVAIRAVNWVFADVIAGGQLRQRVGVAEWAQWLWLHGHVIWHRLEARTICSNHYIANLLGLAVAGSIFPADRAARRWRRFAHAEFPRALLAQTRDDGGLNEASVRYHAFVTEMALLTRLALGTPPAAPAEARLAQMCQAVADLQDATGDVVPFGDDDSGCVLALDWAERTGRVRALLTLAGAQLKREFAPSRDAIYPRSGWWVRRTDEMTLAFEYGGVGLHGIGAHAHNDDLSLTLDWRNRPVIIDPGTFLYTSDPAARDRFRSIRAHNSVIVNGNEPRPLGRSAFQLPGPDAAAEILPWNLDGKAFRRVVGTDASHVRRVRLENTGLILEDEIQGAGKPVIEWRFHLHPSVSARLEAGGFALHVPGAGDLRAEFEGATPRMEIQPAEYSRGYGRCDPSRVCVVRVDGTELPVTGHWRFRPAG